METLIKLMDAWKAGTDCRDQIHDCLIDMGYWSIAWRHFEIAPCLDYTCCSLGYEWHRDNKRSLDWLQAENALYAKEHASEIERQQGLLNG